MIRWRVLFAGRVQGVGFRYTACAAARLLGVTGQVRNLADGRVEMIAEGNEDQLAGLLERIRETTYGDIRDCQVQTSPASGEFTGFTVAETV